MSLLQSDKNKHLMMYFDHAWLLQSAFAYASCIMVSGEIFNSFHTLSVRSSRPKLLNFTRQPELIVPIPLEQVSEMTQ